MYDGGKIIAGLIIGVGLLMSPFFFNWGSAARAPVLELTEKAKEAGQCVASTSYMQLWHMQLLDEWRDTVVREGLRFTGPESGDLPTRLLGGMREFITGDTPQFYAAETEKVYYKSLQMTCMDCHSNKSRFCDQCHDYVGVTPACWDCHIAPKENM